MRPTVGFLVAAPVRRGMAFRPFAMLVLTGLASLGFPSEAIAGPNSGGTLILHLCNWGGECTYEWGYPLCESADEHLQQCEDAEVQNDPGFPGRFFAYAAFPEGSSPRLSRVAFGVDHSWEEPYEWFFLEAVPCADQEITTAGWPEAGEGVILSWDTPRTDILPVLYTFWGYVYYATPGSFWLTPHPTEGGWFEDDSQPPLRDGVVGYGRMGFGEPGELPCPDVPTGATEQGDSWGRIKARYR